MLAVVLCASLTVSASAVKFTDVPTNHWAYSAIQLAATRGVVSGYTDGTFLPSANVTNAQFIVMLSRSFYAWGVYENTPGQPWWWPNWFALNNNSIFQDNEKFSDLEIFKANAGNDLSRYDMALLISGILNEWGRAATDDQKLKAQEEITDYASIPAQYQEAVKASFALGLITGYSDGSFSGEKTMNRAQGCVVIERLTRILNGLTPQQTSAEPSVHQTTDTVTSTLKLRNGKAVTEENVIEIINEVMMVYPLGAPWDESRTKGAGLRDDNVEISGRVLGTMSPALSTINTRYKISMQRACGGFAGVVSDAIFGGGNTGGSNFPARKIDDIRQIRPGDIIITFNNNMPEHVMVATSGVIETQQDEGEEICICDYYDGNDNEAVGTGSAYLPVKKPVDWSYEIWTRYPS